MEIQSTPEYYRSYEEPRDFGAPSVNSVDSGYAEVDPFDKGAQYQDPRIMGFDQNCTISQQHRNPLHYGSFAFQSPMPPHSSSAFSTYAAPTFSAPFQPMVEPTGLYQQYQPSPDVDELSDDGRTGSISSGSPQRASMRFENSPPLKQEPFWPDGSNFASRCEMDNPIKISHTNDEQAVPKAVGSRSRPRKRIPHTAVERRYRENLNAHLEKLRAAVPNITSAQRRKSSEGADPMKPSKCEVLLGAVEYIQHLEQENCRLKRRKSET